MQRKTKKRAAQWLLPTALVLFILEVLLLPLVLELTYAGSGEGPDHVLSYTAQNLSWDAGTDIREDGVAVLDLFDTVYDQVNGQGDKVVAPGTAGSNIIRLKNEADHEISFTVVLYRIRTNDAIAVEPSLTGDGLEDTLSYHLPESVAGADVIRAATGTLEAGRIQDFDIAWAWEFSQGDDQDAADTLLGSSDNDDQVTVGFYIVVEDNGLFPPNPPETGDNGHIYAYLTLMAISLVVVLLLWLGRRREEACQK